MSAMILLKNATVLVPAEDDSDSTVPLRSHCLLIEGSRIKRIAPEIQAPFSDTTVIDCTGKIVSPGFIDTHQHVWEFLLKGRHSDDIFPQYVLKGPLRCSEFEPEDIYWTELAGCLAIIDGGTTTVLDHAHIGESAEHFANGLSAATDSGVRSFFAYTLAPRITSWAPDFVMEGPAEVGAWAMEQLEQLAKDGPFGEGRVQIGVGFDQLGHNPKEFIVDILTRVRKFGAKIITMHMARGPPFWQPSPIELLSEYGLLEKDMVFSHANNCSDNEAKLLHEKQCFISTTPETELQMGLGYPACFSPHTTAVSSLGVDCPSNNSSDMLSQMRLALQVERARRNQSAANMSPLDVRVQDVFRLATIQGAKALNMANEIGSLVEGKLADIVIFDGQSPGMLCASEYDPIAAIVTHASVRDIETVIIDGRIRKQDRYLVPVKTAKHDSKLGWQEIVQRVLQRWSKVQKRIEIQGDPTQSVSEIAVAYLRAFFGVKIPEDWDQKN